MNAGTDWNEGLVAKLTDRWLKGLQVLEIANELGVSRNSVIGKAHRLKLPPRPNPCKPRAGAPARNNLPPVIGGDPMTRKARRVRVRAKVLPKPRKIVVVTGIPPMSAEVATRLAYFKTLPTNGHACSFPLGEPKTPGFHPCGASALESYPYCAEHSALSFIKAKTPKRSNLAGQPPQSPGDHAHDQDVNREVDQGLTG